MTKPSRDETYLKIASVIAMRGTCKRLKVGAILVRDNHIVGTGYNGAPTGEPECIDEGCDVVNGHCVRTIHAEANAIISAARNGISTVNSTIYCTHEPCFRCKQLLKNAGIVHIVYTDVYENGSRK